ncbi:menaquinone biosynthetic enzyme MqnA/MqnD family protein [Hippea jasoniae]|uniref:menaquinone biosynthetic enzyme MqnA/MqnD family protein n=1 Tax=Hippea jasoniae TaxID=944479 RepID=UPI00054D6051|nr:menaquinone biosynthesis protein [Hippea jasoniae]
MKVALVEFLNAVVLYEALKKRIIPNDFEFTSAVPSRCAALLRNGEVDISNVSIVEYVNNPSYKILHDGCIASNKHVKSVVLFLKKPIEKVKSVKLDPNSKTSVALVRVLFRFHFQKTVDYVNTDNADCELVIGDKALKMLKNSHLPHLDLAFEWYKMTALPFVFAAWITPKKLPEEVVEKFIKAKELGKTMIDEICKQFDSLIDINECRLYITKNINYDLTEDKVESIKTFLNLACKAGAINTTRHLEFI